MVRNFDQLGMPQVKSHIKGKGSLGVGNDPNTYATVESAQRETMLHYDAGRIPS